MSTGQPRFGDCMDDLVGVTEETVGILCSLQIMATAMWSVTFLS